MLPFILTLREALVAPVSFQDIPSFDQSKLIFVLATTSDSYDYSSDLRDFTLAAHESCIDGIFRVLDVSIDGITADDLHVEALPAVLCVNSGRSLLSPFTTDDIVTFFNQHSITPVPYLSIEEDLKLFLDSTGLGLLCSFKNASDETLPEVVKLFREHFNEFTLAYCDPALTGAEAFFLYRHSDNAMVEIERTLFGEPAEQIERILARYMVPDVAKADMRVVSNLERRSERFAFLAIDTQQNFYLSPAQLDLAREIQVRCGLKVLYELSMFVSLSAVRYGFPENVGNGQLRVVEFAGETQAKYLLNGDVTGDSAEQFCQRIKNGDEKRFWRSEPIPSASNGLVQKVVADNYVEFVEKGLSIIGLFWFDNACLRHFAAAAESIVKMGYRVKIAQFGLARNDWPGPNTTLIELPRIIAFRDKELLSNVRSANTTEQVLQQLLEQLKPTHTDQGL
jgi:hypothetical protein